MKEVPKLESNNVADYSIDNAEENPSNEVARSQEHNDDEFYKIHEEVFRTEQPMLVDETPDQYNDRVNKLWLVRREQLSLESKRGLEQKESVSDSVTAWITHPKIAEYAHRYRRGESIDEMLQEQANFSDKKEAVELLAAALDLETVEKDQERIEDSGLEEIATVSFELVSEEDRDKLSGWSASYELARVAHNEGENLTDLTREEYAEYAVEKGLMIDDSQLRAAPWERVLTSPEDIVTRRKEIEASIPESHRDAFDQFCKETRTQAAGENRFLSENIRIRQGTKDSDSWLYFGINDSTRNDESETHKAYLTFKDLSTFSPDRFLHFLEALRDSGYNGDVKTFQDMAHQGILLNDQVVMHGASSGDVALANNVAQQFFGEDLLDVGIGKDEEIDGESKSYSQILAAKIKQDIKQRAR